MATRTDPDGATLRDLRRRAQEARDASSSGAWRAFQRLIEELDPEVIVALCDDYQEACAEIETLTGKLEEATTTEEG